MNAYWNSMMKAQANYLKADVEYKLKRKPKQK